ncbi:hypothetical protein GO755_04440 [Spirosoma sp. HMF4905]|uniref:GTPase-associated system helical domain-containing protein n=1 Tax=Spirosoma arboris TaxID=2682092 RepID=A0A7K1S6C2_9BACT|nr:GTPase-associated system all-helical protein GASH [Spirosoma arboris]MVM29270.1 hypothetical protein [Spirosoma arboris]
MSKPVLEALLQAHIITIEQDDNFDRLTEAVDEVEKRLRAQKNRIAQISQLAFDPDTNPEEPSVIEVQEIISDKWKSFSSKCQDRPVPYVRAVMLGALQRLATDVNIAGIIWLTVSNYLPFIKGAQRETSLLQALLYEIGNVYERAGWIAWGLTENYTLPAPPKIVPIINEPISLIDREEIVERMKAAVGGSDEDSNRAIFFDFNNYYTGNIQIRATNEWSTSFGSIASSAIQAVASQIIDGTNNALAEVANLKQLEAYTSEITRFLGNVAVSINQQTATHNLRSRLLWLKESLYSVSQQKSYRGLPSSILSLALAVDMLEIVPTIYPVSVNFFIKETMTHANSGASLASTFEEILGDVSANKDVAGKTLSTISQPESGRLSLLEFLGNLILGSLKIENFEEVTGLQLSSTITWEELSVWIFKELQVKKLATAK